MRKSKDGLKKSFVRLERVISVTDQQQLCQRFGFAKLRLHQISVPALIEAGRDVLMLVNTGGGKTEAILASKLLNPSCGILVQIEPLRALQADMQERIARIGLRVAVLNSDVPPSLYRQTLEQIKQGWIDCLLTTPEQLEKKAVFKSLNEAGIAYIAIDEAHALVEWGGDFRPSYDRIGTFIKHLDKRPAVVACTATLAPDGIKKVIRSLNLCDPVLIGGSVDRPEIAQHFVEIGTAYCRAERDLVERERLHRMKQAIKKYCSGGDGCIIYCNTVTQTKVIAQHLQKKKFCALAFYAELPAKKKEEIRRQFRSKCAPIIVATSAFGMGMDKPNIRLIVHMSMPLSVEDYWQKTGRAGRDGKKSISLVLWHQSDFDTNRTIVGVDGIKYRKLQKLRRFITDTRCYVQQLREYFGQDGGKPCGCCSNCRH